MMNNRQESGGRYPFPMTKRALIGYIVVIILIGLFFFFVRADMAGKIAACIVCPCTILYLIYAYRKERKADSKADESKARFMDGSYFESPEWHEEYLAYRNAHPFQRPECQSMKKDLLKKFQRREYIATMVISLFLMICTACLIPMEQYVMAALGFCIFGYLFYTRFSLYIGMPVRKWLKGGVDYNLLESSYLSSRMLLYKKSGLAFGTTHIHAFTEEEIYAVDYRPVQGISRKIVRLKEYEDGIYNKEEYRHFAVIHVRLPQSGNIQDVEIELNEFQVQMAIDMLAAYKIGGESNGAMMVSELKENENV